MVSEAHKKAQYKYAKSIKGKEALKKAQYKYAKSIKGKEALKRANHKYSRTIKGRIKNNKAYAKFRGYKSNIPLNCYDSGMVGHHISEYFIIFIPNELHKSIKHNLKNDENMDLINQLSFNYLLKDLLNYDKIKNKDHF